MGVAIASLGKGVKETWDKLNKVQRIIVTSAIALAFVVSSAFLILHSRGPEYEILWSNLDPQDAGSIVTELERQSIPYKITDGGRTLRIPADQVYRTRLGLASQGLPSSGVVGFESIGGNSIWATDFERRVQYVRALSGELTRTVKAISGIDDARVHIALPAETVFAAYRTPPTAAVLLKLGALQELSPSAVRGIANLVARSVEGLSASDVTIMDTQGRLLSQEYQDGALAGVTASAYDLTSKVERDLEKRLVSMLSPVLGAGNVVCQVRANLNLDQVRTTEEVYLTDPEMPQGTLRSTQETREVYQGSGSPAGGPAGGLDVPTYASGGTQGESSYQRSETTRNFEVTRTVTETMVNPGAVKDLSVALFVNKEMDEEQTGEITKAVTAALGLDSGRQDKISVIALKFDTSLSDEIQRSMVAVEPGLNKAYIYAGAVVAALIVGTVILMLLRRRRTGQPETMASPVQTTKELEEEQMPPEVLSKQRLRNSVEQTARLQPQAVAALIKTWLLEDEH